MNTPAHAAINLCLLATRAQPTAQVAVLVGAALPDLPMIGFYFVQKAIIGRPEVEIWGEAYYDATWQAFFDIFNSLPLMIIGALLCTWLGYRLLRLMLVSMMLHVVGDLPLHHDDAHRHFYPFSDWRFESPLSYWDPNHYGHIVSAVELVVAFICLIIVFRYANRVGQTMALAIAGIYAAYVGYVFLVWA